MNSKKARIAVVGSYAVGMTISCTRFPEEGETVTGRNFKMLHGGKGSNQAIAVARLGGLAELGAAVGYDSFGENALAMLIEEGVKVDCVSKKLKFSTGVGLITVSDSGNNQIVIDLGANEALSVDDILEMQDSIAGSDLLLVQLEANLDAVVKAIDIACLSGVPIILNPAPFRSFSEASLVKASYLTPNETEAAALLGINPESTPDGKSLAAKLHQQFGNAVIVTLGEQGAYVRTKEIDCLVRGFPSKCVDTTGAGDTFSAALAVGIGEGMELVEAVTFANMAASMSVEIEGVVPSIPYRKSVNERLTKVSGRSI